MRKTLVAAVLCAIATSAVATENKVPSIGNAPDYRLTVVFKAGEGQPSSPYSLLHHAGWTKLLGEGPDGQTEFQGPDDDLMLLLFRSGGKLAGLRFELHQYPRPTETGQVTDTGEDWTIAGETCHVWKSYHGDRKLLGFRRDWFKCLTRDGITLASGALDAKGNVSTSREATKIERVPLTWADVLPSNNAVAQRLWLSPNNGAPQVSVDRPDFEMRMMGRAGEQVLRRRHYPWNYEDVRQHDGRRKIRIWNEQANQGLSVQVDPSGQIENAYGRNEKRERRGIKSDFDLVTTPKISDKLDTILGERCQWWDMSPYVSDAGQSQCQTPDGIPLRIAHSSVWGEGSDYTAIELRRVKQDMKDFAMPDALWSVQTWGFPP